MESKAVRTYLPVSKGQGVSQELAVPGPAQEIRAVWRLSVDRCMGPSLLTGYLRFSGRLLEVHAIS